MSNTNDINDEGPGAKEVVLAKVVLANADVMGRVLSFLWLANPTNRSKELLPLRRFHYSYQQPKAANMTVRHVSRFILNFGLVCKPWQDACLRARFGPLDVEPFNRRGEEVDRMKKYWRGMAKWFGNFSPPLKIGSLLGFEGEIKDLLDVLSKCDTQELKHAEIELWFFSENMVPLLHELYESLCKSTVLQGLTIKLSPSSKATNSSTDHYATLISSSPLISKKTTQRFHLISKNIPRWIPNLLIANFAVLTHLELKNSTRPPGITSPQEPFHIVSNTLRSLDVECLRFTNVFCKCPSLLSYTCCANNINRTHRTGWSGSLPDVATQDEYDLVCRYHNDRTREVSSYLRVKEGKLATLLGRPAFVGLDVPASCMIIFSCWGVAIQNGEWADEPFEEFLPRVRSVQRSFASLTP